MFLPRQAQDKHQEDSTRGDCVSHSATCSWPNNMLQSYGRALYNEPHSTWSGFGGRGSGSWVPHAVVVNLGENDGFFDVKGTPPGTIGPTYHWYGQKR